MKKKEKNRAKKNADYKTFTRRKETENILNGCGRCNNKKERKNKTYAKTR